MVLRVTVCRNRLSGRPHSLQQGKIGEKEITDRMLSARHIVGLPELTSVCREALR
ncbi:hypothetical protein TUM17577_47560 [Enterobacter asburiae]|nr:hypothetical protein TUM17577_47560 [Enterobacter asburiae]